MTTRPTKEKNRNEYPRKEDRKVNTRSLGKILHVVELHNLTVGNRASLIGDKGSRLGLASMINAVTGSRSMDGYEVKTTKHTFFLLIDNDQSCCESFGYFSSDDNLKDHVGAELKDIEMTDTSLSTKTHEEVKYLDEGGVQFVTFKTSRGDFQLAVYNAHNGYYGHGILFTKDDKILLDNTL